MQSTVQGDVEKSNRQNRKQTVKWIKRGFQEVYKAPWNPLLNRYFF